MSLEPRPKRIYIQENTDIRFEQDPKTGEAIMYICGEEFTRKNVPAFTERFVRKYFRNEIEENKDVLCPVDLDHQETKEER
jgi:hypothetical protein